MNWKEQFDNDTFEVKNNWGHLVNVIVASKAKRHTKEIIEKLIEDAHNEYSQYSTYETSLEATKQQLINKWL